MGRSINANLSTKGLNDLQNKLSDMQKTLKKYEGNHNIELPYTKEQWNDMTELEKNEAIEEAKNEYINQIRKELFK